MRLTFVGHASVLVESGSVGLLSDPWVRGSAFNDSWLPHPAPSLPDETLDRVTHLWISHEHPDHLSIPTLTSLPPERRSSITVLYQRHWSPLTARFLRSLGFRDVLELPHNRVVPLGDGVRVRLYQVGHEDAALAVHAGGRTILNLNDCKPSDRTLADIRRRLGPIDALLDQFSIAGWPGNPDDADAHAEASQHTLHVLRHHVDVLEPRTLVPFASFARFAHVENAYMNAAANTVGDVVELGLRPSIGALYPGDQADVDELADGTDVAIARYDADRRRLPELPLNTSDPVPVDEVVAAADAFVADVRRAFHRTVLQRIPPLGFVLTDAGDRRIDVAVGAGTTSNTTVELSTQAAHHTFTERWGFPTLLISGRFRLHGPPQPFTRMKQLGALYSNQFRTRGALRDAASYRGVDLLGRRGPRAWLDLAGRIGR